MSDLPPRPSRRRPRQKQQGAPLWLMALIVIALVGTMVWVTDHFVEFDKMQRCATSGHRDCGPPIEPPK